MTTWISRAVVVAAAAGVAATAATARAPAVSLSRPLPSIVRVGDDVSVAGHVSRRGRVELELARGTEWKVVAGARAGRHRAFALRWSVAAGTAIGPVKLRVALVRHGTVLARTAAVQSAIGPAPVYCNPPTPPSNVPQGDGWIVGGLYLIGGPFPGIDECSGQSYTVTATDSASGVVAATQTVSAGDSYTLVVPAGSYKLMSGFCRGTATVTAGKQTQADTNCPVP